MKNKKFALVALATAVAGGCATVQMEPRMDYGSTSTGVSATMLADTCAGCHGTNGASQGPATPTLAGLSSEYMVETMAAYKSGERFSTIMQRIAKGYTDEEIALMAKFFGKQKYVLAPQSADSTLAARGAKLHDKYCEKCHEDGGRSKEDDAGLLAGQWMPYLQTTMDDYVSGLSKILEKKMRTKVKRMLKEEGAGSVEALVHYYGSQK